MTFSNRLPLISLFVGVSLVAFNLPSPSGREAGATLTFVLHSTAAMNYDPSLLKFDSVAERAVSSEIAFTFTWSGP